MQILTPEARSRLTNLKLAKPDLVNQIEIQLIQSAQSGSLRGKVTDEQLKVLLSQISGQKDKFILLEIDCFNMKACVLYSGGKDSSLMAVILHVWVMMLI